MGRAIAIFWLNSPDDLNCAALVPTLLEVWFLLQMLVSEEFCSLEAECHQA